MIRVPEVRLISEDGRQAGVVATEQAMELARTEGLDLVEVSPMARPPVCKILDYGKYKFEQEKRIKESKRKQKLGKLKEIRMQPKIERHDLQFKARQVRQFLEEGNKVKVTIMFRGREVQHPELGKKILDDVAATVEHVGKVEFQPRQDGRNMVMVLAPDKQAQARHRRRLEAEAALAATETPQPGTAE